MDIDRLTNLRRAYEELERRVQRALNTQVGDGERLTEVQNEVLSYSQAVEQHLHLFSPEELSYCRQNTELMTNHLDQARQMSSDPLEDPVIPFVRIVRTGKRGRPRVEIEPSLLSTALTLRPKTKIARTASCSARTIRRRQLDYRIEVPGPSYSQTQQVGGDSSSSVLCSGEVSDEELDRHLAIIIQDFPSFGRRMATSCLRENGVMVSEERVRESFLRTSGVPGVFGGRRVHRRKYQVAGANSLWHHDGQHGICYVGIQAFKKLTQTLGLIRWKIVIHAFIDGKSRLVVGIRAHNNNRANTVLGLFLDATLVHGIPSRVRGDHGTENVRVAEWMEENQGTGRGSYIWGRSVHNSRIERIWYDVTEGFGGKWKNLFTDLEANEGLDVDNPAHIWLLQHLFLDHINQDSLAWAEAWNGHKLQIRGEPQQTPQEMFFFSMIEDGPRGLNGPRQSRQEDQDGVDGEDIHLYGVDWEVMEDDEFMAHHHQHNPTPIDNLFGTAPPSLSEVECTPPNCPLSAEGVRQLDNYLSQVVDVNSRSMLVRRSIWVQALHTCGQIL